MKIYERLKNYLRCRRWQTDLLLKSTHDCAAEYASVQSIMRLAYIKCQSQNNLLVERGYWANCPFLKKTRKTCSLLSKNWICSFFSAPSRDTARSRESFTPCWNSSEFFGGLLKIIWYGAVLLYGDFKTAWTNLPIFHTNDRFLYHIIKRFP